MEDRFKFRAWLADKKEFYYFTFFDIQRNPVIETTDSIMQCTGLEDKNGQLIWEGDIISYKNTKYEIVWDDDGYWRVWPISEDKHLRMADIYDIDWHKNCEVVGNEFENMLN